MSINKMRKNLKETADGQPADAGKVFKSSGDYRADIRKERETKRGKVDKAKDSMTEKYSTNKETGVKTKNPKQKVDRKTMRQDKKKKIGATREKKKADRKEERKTYRDTKKEVKSTAKKSMTKDKYTTNKETGVKTKNPKQKLDRKQIRKNAAKKAADKVVEKRKIENNPY